jgi:thiamine-monophosphate kinase
MNEFGLIQQFFAEAAASRAASKNDSTLSLGIGDDCALITPPHGQQLAISTDTLVAGRHFPLETDAYSIGWKAVAVNLSDLAAMGATPYSILLALSLPSADEDFLREFSRGLFAICDQYGVQLIGGDTTRSTVLSISITVLGWLPIGQAITRGGAQAGDLIMVTGTLGDAAYALRHPHSPLQHRLDRPLPRVAFGQALRGYASAMLDISDGLAQDLGHIAQASGLDACVDVENVPLHSILQHLVEGDLHRPAVWQYALAGGDDYELCFTVPERSVVAVMAEADLQQVQVTQIGRMLPRQSAKTQVQLRLHQQPFVLQQTGFQHFG